jgi:hypothetical protein
MATLARRSFTVTDQAGNIVPFAWVEVKSATLPGAPSPVLYPDRAGALPTIGNPFQTGADGFAKFHCVGDAYTVRAYLGPSGAPTFEQIFDFDPIGTAAEYDHDALLSTLADGTVALPSLAFALDPNTGIYRIAADRIGVACGGTKILDIAASGLTVTGNVSGTGTLHVFGPGGSASTSTTFFRLNASSGASQPAVFEILTNSVTRWQFGMMVGGSNDFAFYRGGSALFAFRISSADDSVSFNATTASTSTTSGAVVIAGGLGVAGAINAANFLNYASPAFSTYVGVSSGASHAAGGNHNTALGYQTLANNTVGTDNTAVGYRALANNIHTAGSEGVQNTAVGSSALVANTTGFNNVAVGTGAMLSNVSGSSNMAVGQGSLQSLTTGTDNAAIGNAALQALVSGSANVAIGSAAGNTTTSGNNVFIGFAAGFSDTSGANNIVIGANPSVNKGPTTGSKNILIGYDCDLATVTASNQLNIGNAIFGTGLSGTGTTIAGKIGILKNNPAVELDLVGAFNATSASAAALAVGLNGATNPAFQVDASTASQAAGLKITGAATLGTVAIAVIDTGANTNLTIDAKGTGTIGIGSSSTGVVSIKPVTNLTSATATPANGSTAARLLFGTTAGFGIYYGSGAPTVSAAQGSIYLRSDGAVNARLYINNNGTTGWSTFNTLT